MPNREFTNINGIKVCDETARNSIPTKTSQLTNDSGYITNIPDEYITETELNAKGYATTSQIPTVPTNVSELTNDVGYVNNEALNNATTQTLSEAQNYTNTKLDNKSLKALTQAEYDSLATKDENVIYFITDKNPNDDMFNFKILSSEDATI